MKKNLSEALRRSYISNNGLDAITSLDIFAISELHEFDKKEYLIQSNAPSKYLYFLVKGEAIVTHDALDRTICVSYVKPICWLGEAASLWRQKPSCNVQALSPCTCIAINLWQYREALISDLLFMQNTCQILNGKLNEAAFARSDLLEPLEVRLARFILRTATQDAFDLHLTNCAIILNASYRHLLRIVKDFCDRNILEKHKSRYQVVDREALARYSEGDLP